MVISERKLQLWYPLCRRSIGQGVFPVLCAHLWVGVVYSQEYRITFCPISIAWYGSVKEECFLLQPCLHWKKKSHFIRANMRLSPQGCHSRSCNRADFSGVTLHLHQCNQYQHLQCRQKRCWARSSDGVHPHRSTDSWNPTIFAYLSHIS